MENYPKEIICPSVIIFMIQCIQIISNSDLKVINNFKITIQFPYFDN